MEEKIRRIKSILEDLEVMICILEGGLSKEDMREGGGIVKVELDCYRNDGNNLQEIINALFKEHGDEVLPTFSQITQINRSDSR